MSTTSPRSPEELASEIVAAARNGLTVVPVGRSTRLGGRGALEIDAATPIPAAAPVPDIVIRTSELRRVFKYEPADLTVTVEAGIELEELDRVLGERGQFLPIGDAICGGTVGGLLATASEGPFALRYGMPRDWLIGMRIALADGSLVKGGGRVVKTVAGYPIHRLMIGSHGTLGVIVEASFKVAPRPERHAMVFAAFASPRAAFEASHRVLTSELEPRLVNVLTETGTDHGWLLISLDGSESRVRAHLERLQNLLDGAIAGTLRVVEWNRKDRSTDSAAAGAGFPVWQQSMFRLVPSGTPVRAVMRAVALPSRTEELAGRVLAAAAKSGAKVAADARPGLGTLFVAIESESSSATVESLEAALDAARSIGSATVHDAPASIRAGVDPWGPPPPDFPLMRRIKQALDPAGTMLPGRFIGGL